MRKIYTLSIALLNFIFLGLSSMCAFSQCDAIHVPYTEDFESYTGTTFNDNNGVVPTCWTNYTTNAIYGVPHVVSSSNPNCYAHSGSNSMVFTGSFDGPTAYAILPTFIEPLNILKIHFWSAYECLTCGDLCIGYVTDISDPENSFVYVDVVTPFAYNNGGDTISFDLSTYPDIPATGNICFYWYRMGSYYSCWIDDIVVTQSDLVPDTCAAPRGLNALITLGETDASVSLLWIQDGGEVDSWDVDYREVGTTEWSTVTANAIPFVLPGLQFNTDYEIQTRAHCNNGLISDPSNLITVHITDTGVDDFNLEKSVSMYPNPTDGELKIENGELKMENVQVYDVYGKLLMTVEVNGNTTTIDASSFSSGIYFVKVKTENGVVTKRFLKN